MNMMCVTSLVAASKERQTGAKSSKAGKVHSADKRALPDWRYKAIAAPRDIDNESIPITSVTQRAAQCRNMDGQVGRLANLFSGHFPVTADLYLQFLFDAVVVCVQESRRYRCRRCNIGHCLSAKRCCQIP
jgi:hypothetical protein